MDFKDPPLLHTLVEDVSLVLEQVPDDVLAVAADQAPLNEAGLVAAGAQANTWNLFAFLFRQEEALVGQLCNRLNQADSVEDVVAVEQPDILIGHLDCLLAKRAGRFIIGRCADALWLGRVEQILEWAERLGLALDAS